MELPIFSNRQDALEHYFQHILTVLDPNPEREGLKETHERATKAWQYWVGGYEIDPVALFKTFEDGGADYDQMVVVSNIEFFSTCEHHLCPIIGKATVAYIPNNKIVGLSKIPRVIDAFARRLQTQERITTQIANCLWDNLIPIGVGVHLMARHLCMESRGIHKVGSVTHTTALRGAVKDEPETRAEFLSMINRDMSL